MAKATKNSVQESAGVEFDFGDEVGQSTHVMSRKLKVSVKTYKGRKFVDVRTHYQGQNGEWFPTKKGVTIGKDDLPVIIKGLQLAISKL
jgi:hypothetical protein